MYFLYNRRLLFPIDQITLAPCQLIRAQLGILIPTRTHCPHVWLARPPGITSRQHHSDLARAHLYNALLDPLIRITTQQQRASVAQPLDSTSLLARPVLAFHQPTSALLEPLITTVKPTHHALAVLPLAIITRFDLMAHANPRDSSALLALSMTTTILQLRARHAFILVTTYHRPRPDLASLLFTSAPPARQIRIIRPPHRA